MRVVGDGQNHWPCVYDRDLADLYVRVAASAGRLGHLPRQRRSRRTRGRHRRGDRTPRAKTRPDVRHVPIEEARTKMGPYADALALDQIVRSPRARALGWAPTLHSVAGNVARLLEEFRTASEAAA